MDIRSSIYWDDLGTAAQAIAGAEALSGRSVLITGATGLICSAVADLLFFLNEEQGAGINILLAGRSVHRMRRRFAGFAEGEDYMFVPFEAEKAAVPAVDPDYIIHGAGAAYPAIYRAQPVEVMLAGTTGLNTLLTLAAQRAGRRLLFISSSEVYGQKADGRPFREEDHGYVDILSARATYPSVKRAGETLCAAYGAEHQTDTVIVRPGHIYGPSITPADDRVSAQFTRAAVLGRDIVMKSAGTQRRSYCYTLDCATAILTALLKGRSGAAYNISNRNSVVSIRELAEAFARQAGTKVLFETATAEEKAGYTPMECAVLDAERLEALGWRACFDLAQGVERTVRLLREGPFSDPER